MHLMLVATLWRHRHALISQPKRLHCNLRDKMASYRRVSCIRRSSRLSGPLCHKVDFPEENRLALPLSSLDYARLDTGKNSAGCEQCATSVSTKSKHPKSRKKRRGRVGWWWGGAEPADGAPTTGHLLPGVRRHDEYKQGEARQKQAGHHQVKHVVEVAAADVNGESDVDVLLGTTVIADDVTLGGGACKNSMQLLIVPHTSCLPCWLTTHHRAVCIPISQLTYISLNHYSHYSETVGI